MRHDCSKTLGRQIDAGILRFISPMGFEHINFNGVIVFPFPALRGSTANLAPGRARSKRLDLTGAPVDRDRQNLLIYML